MAESNDIILIEDSTDDEKEKSENQNKSEIVENIKIPVFPQIVQTIWTVQFVYSCAFIQQDCRVATFSASSV